MAMANAEAPLRHLPKLQRMPIRAARERLGALVDRVASGSYVLICRRSTPLAVLLPAGDFDLLAETVRREEELAAILRGRGYDVEPWTTPTVLEVVTRVLDGGQG